MSNLINFTNVNDCINSWDDGRMLHRFWILIKSDNVPKIGVTLSKPTRNTPLLSCTHEYVRYIIIRYIRNTCYLLTNLLVEVIWHPKNSNLKHWCIRRLSFVHYPPVTLRTRLQMKLIVDILKIVSKGFFALVSVLKITLLVTKGRVIYLLTPLIKRFEAMGAGTCCAHLYETCIPKNIKIPSSKLGCNTKHWNTLSFHGMMSTSCNYFNKQTNSYWSCAVVCARDKCISFLFTLSKVLWQRVYFDTYVTVRLQHNQI